MIPDWARDAVSELAPLLDPDAAANFLGVHKRTLARYSASGRLKTIRLGESGSAGVRVPRLELARFLAERAR